MAGQWCQRGLRRLQENSFLHWILFTERIMLHAATNYESWELTWKAEKWLKRQKICTFLRFSWISISSSIRKNIETRYRYFKISRYIDIFDNRTCLVLMPHGPLFQDILDQNVKFYLPLGTPFLHTYLTSPLKAQREIGKQVKQSTVLWRSCS